MAASKAPRRSDAQRNREAILSAARELFAESGDVPMYEIARRAGVGQATLYRHFADRNAVGLAIFAEQLEHLERVAEDYADDAAAFFVLLRAVVQLQVEFHGLIDCVRGESGAESDQKQLKRRFIQLIREPLRRAKAAALVRPDLGIDDVFLLIAMVGGALQRQETVTARAAAGARALTLGVEGLGA